MSRCPLCPGKNTCVSPSGPEDSKIHCIAEAPGAKEDKKGVPLIGPTGEEFNRGYLPVAGLRRENIYVDNAISCLPDRVKGKLDPKKKADLDLLQSCAEHHLYPNLKRLQPELIVAMGGFACRALDPSIDLEMHHGIPMSTDWGTVFPMYHPAGGIHEPKKMLLIRTDWHRLRKYMLGKLRIPVDKYRGREHYREIEDEAHLRSVLDGCNDYTMGCDTENKRGGEPFCLTFSIEPGTGYLIRAEREDLLAVYQEYLDKWQGWILWHNWMWDATVVAKMGLRFPRRLIKDTMVVVFHLGNLPQGLKPLAYRELGMEMQDFDDLVTPYSKPRVIDYYESMLMVDWPKPEPEMYRVEGGQWKVRQPQSLSRKVKTFFTFYNKNNEKDVFEPWDSNWEECHEMVERECGPFPGKCISHVPFEKALHYACRDADGLLRLWPILQYMKKRVRKFPQENWQEGLQS